MSKLMDAIVDRVVGDLSGTQPSGSNATLFVGRPVLIRTYSAGVHFGTLVSRDGREVVLRDARRIWSWSGANTLSEIALRGVSAESKISEAVPEIVLTEAIEVIPLADDAVRVLGGVKWKK